MKKINSKIIDFLNKSKLNKYRVLEIAGDASDRKYYRLMKDKHSLILMDSSRTFETLNNFINVRNYLSSNQLSVPEIFNIDMDNGFLVLEDFGDKTIDKYLINCRDIKIYELIVDLVISLNNLKDPPFPKFNKQFFLEELSVFVKWYIPLINGSIEEKELHGFYDCWDQSFEYLIKEDVGGVFVHKDLHCSNLFWLPNRSGIRRLGIIDFQAAKKGSVVYDLTSFLYDCRLPLQNVFRDDLIKRYLKGRNWDYQNYQNLCDIYIAQRNIKILGNFAYLYKRKGKEAYLKFLPNAWDYLKMSLKNPVLKDVRVWFENNTVKLLDKHL